MESQNQINCPYEHIGNVVHSGLILPEDSHCQERHHDEKEEKKEPKNRGGDDQLPGNLFLLVFIGGLSPGKIFFNRESFL